MQYWEISEEQFGVMPNGCSLHIDVISHERYVDNVYQGRDGQEPEFSYVRMVGTPIIVTINDDLFSHIVKDSHLILEEIEMNNLIKLRGLVVT